MAITLALASWHFVVTHCVFIRLVCFLRDIIYVHPTPSAEVCARPPVRAESASATYMLEQCLWSDPEALATICSDMKAEGLERGDAGSSMHTKVTDHQPVADTNGMHGHPAAELQDGPAQAPSACLDVRASDGVSLPH